MKQWLLEEKYDQKYPPLVFDHFPIMFVTKFSTKTKNPHQSKKQNKTKETSASTGNVQNDDLAQYFEKEKYISFENLYDIN